MHRILLIEDDAQIRNGLCGLLTRMNYAVVQAGDGATALELFRSQPADLVITDMLMPGMKGEAVIRAIREMAPGVRIIAISGNPSLELDLPFGADCTLAKPFSPWKLVESVRALLATRNPDR